MIIVGLALLLLAAVAQAADVTMDNTVRMDAVVEASAYQAYYCIGSETCLPITRAPELDILQPTVGDPMKKIPTVLKGRFCYRAIKASNGMESLTCSNIAPFWWSTPACADLITQITTMEQALDKAISVTGKQNYRYQKLALQFRKACQ